MLRMARRHLAQAQDILGAFVADDCRVQKRGQDERFVTQEIGDLRFGRHRVPVPASLAQMEAALGYASLIHINGAIEPDTILRLLDVPSACVRATAPDGSSLELEQQE